MRWNGWWRECLRIALLFAALGALGGFLGMPLLGLLAAAVLYIALWLRQMWRTLRWLRVPGREPPEAAGLWGEGLWEELYRSIHHFKRRDQEERDRLQTAVSYLRDSLAALKDGTILVDPAGNIEWCSEAAGRLLGVQYPRDRGQPVLSLVLSQAFHDYFMGGDYRLPLVTESPRNPDVRLQFEITLFGRGSRLVFARDVTGQFLVERMRRDFVANVSHELRTPLTVITGYLHNLSDLCLDERGGADARLAQPLEQMQQQAERMETLLHDLLWLSQIEATEGQVEHAKVNMGELLNEVCQAARVAYPGRALKLRLSCGDGVRGDYRQLYSAVSNLVVNALKYGQGDVEVAWRRRESDLCLSVSDQGPGIEERHLPRLTERFYRVDKSRSKATGGTGLGLAIVKHVLMAHTARLEIDSEVGTGSTFRCVFPDGAGPG